MGRRQKRYERRMQKRKENREKKLKENLKFESVYSYAALYKAARASAKGVRWKESVQRYRLNLFTNLYHTRNDLIKNKDIRQGFIEFDINERGKIRHIRSVRMREKVVQKSFCINVYTPVMTYNLIADNGASQKGKGTHYAIQRLLKYLRKYYKRYGNKGYILLIDFKSYFDNIQHKPLKELIRKQYTDPQIIKYADYFIDAFGDKGLGLGSETSQINAIAYINEIDHYIKEKANVRGYGRYMDDSFIIHESKQELLKIYKQIKVLYEKYGIILNSKKTVICKLNNYFNFLKTRFIVQDSGKILKKPCRVNITRERRKLKKQKKLLEQDKLTQQDTDISFVSWKGSMRYKNAARSVFNMQLLYERLFNGKEKNK